MEEQGVAPLRPDDPPSGSTDSRHLPRRDEHPAGAPDPGGAVQGRDRQGHGQPGLAPSENRLGSLVEALARRGGHRPVDPRRHRRARPARQEGADPGSRRSRSASPNSRGRSSGRARKREKIERELDQLQLALEDLEWRWPRRRPSPNQRRLRQPPRRQPNASHQVKAFHRPHRASPSGVPADVPAADGRCLPRRSARTTGCGKIGKIIGIGRSAC